MAAVINGCAWDGAWYARSFDDGGLPIGVSGAAHHAIDLIPQSWAVMGEVAPQARAEQAMRSADEQLNTKFGLVLLRPPYDGADPRVCGTATFLPGAKENGGIFCHSNPWSVVAAAMLGWGEEAYRYYRQILPLARTDSDVYKVEPYVYPQNICGRPIRLSGWPATRGSPGPRPGHSSPPPNGSSASGPPLRACEWPPSCRRPGPVSRPIASSAAPFGYNQDI